MGNMSYCRFRNTFFDLRDCYDNMDEPASEEEKRFRLKLIKLCSDIHNDYGEELED